MSKIPIEEYILNFSPKIVTLNKVAASGSIILSDDAVPAGRYLSDNVYKK